MILIKENNKNNNDIFKIVIFPGVAIAIACPRRQKA